MLDLSSQDKSTDAIHYLITILCNPGPMKPFLEYGPKATTYVENWIIFLELTQHKNNKTHPL